MKRTLSFKEPEVYQLTELLCDHIWEVIHISIGTTHNSNTKQYTSVK
ncbi:hypothetical protein [Catalinimonas alkaloidigena]|nr:hypothetical protein [Catalinimonas alkaloidigena]